jgi:hypothetical protein
MEGAPSLLTKNIFNNIQSLTEGRRKIDLKVQVLIWFFLGSDKLRTY